MKLFETITQTRKGKESTLVVTVEYDPNEKCVDEVISFEVISGKATIDITDIMTVQHDAAGDSIVNQIDWHLNYIEQEEHRREALEDMHRESSFDLADFANNMFKSMSRI
jgi:hypothetical protein